MKIRIKIQKAVFSFISIFLIWASLSACKNNDDLSSGNEASFEKVNVAVVLPLTEGSIESQRFRRVADWYLSTLERATSLYSTPFTFNIEWYDENTQNLEELAAKLSSRSDLLAVIGPMYSSHVQTFADKCYDTKKTMITPCASSETVIRAYAVNSAVRDSKIPFLWSLTESDVSQIEAMLSKVSAYGGKKIALLSSADVYGKTFFDWVPFLATELKLELVKNVVYVTDTVKKEYESGTEPVSLEEASQTVIDSGADFVLCAFASCEDAEVLLEKRSVAGDSAPRLIFSDTAFEDKLLSFVKDGVSLAEGVEGTAPYADPESAFVVDYMARFGENPMLGEAHFFDSLLLCSYAAAGCFRNKKNGDTDAFSNEKVNEELRKMNDAVAGKEYAWNLIGMIVALKNLDKGVYTNLCGATGLLDFDKETLTSALYSIYVHWCVVDGKFVPLEFTSTENSSHSSGNRASWEWIASFDDNEDVEDSEDSSVTYGDMESQWAVIVAASTTWPNYRHQADALYVYQLLKNRKRKFQDDHIILIIADDIANHKRNKRPGEVIARLDGENLYKDMEIDYLLEELSVEDMSNIMQGKSIELQNREALRSTHKYLAETPTILKSNEASNIIWFWSGHGVNINGNSENGYFVWEGKNSTAKGFTTDLMRQTLESMEMGEDGEKHFRQLLILTEACYSASVMHICEGIEGVLAFTAANGSETSLADIYSVELKVWISNRFTKNFFDYYMENIDSKAEGVVYSDLYKYLVKNTIGSHVRLFNGSNFGNLYTLGPKELIEYEKD